MYQTPELFYSTIDLTTTILLELRSRHAHDLLIGVKILKYPKTCNNCFTFRRLQFLHNCFSFTVLKKCEGTCRNHSPVRRDFFF